MTLSSHGENEDDMYAQQTKVVGLVLSVCVSAMSGCALFEMRDIRPEYSGILRDGQVVSLDQRIHRNCVLNGPQYNDADLVLGITEGNELIWEASVGRTSGYFKESPEFRFGKLEGRESDDGERVWLIDETTSAFVAAIDLTDGCAVGINDEPPKWAKPGGGIPLKCPE